MVEFFFSKISGFLIQKWPRVFPRKTSESFQNTGCASLQKKIHDSCINYILLCMPQQADKGIQPTSHWKAKKFHWVMSNWNRRWLTSLKNYSDKINRSFFPPVRILFRPCSHLAIWMLWFQKGPFASILLRLLKNNAKLISLFFQ